MANHPTCVVNVHGHLRHDQNIDARVRLWEQWNVRKFCCLCLGKLYEDYFTNDDFLPWQKRYPDLLVGMGHIDLGPESADTPETISRLKDQGFAGLKFIAPSNHYDHDRYLPFYDRAQNLDMPILFHTGYVARTPLDGAYGVDSENMRPYHFDRIARMFPQLKMIGAHFGLPHPDEAASMLLGHPNVYFDMSGGSGAKAHEYRLRRFMAPPAGSDMTDPAENPALTYFEKMCFGTDNPEPSVWVPVAARIMDVLQIPEPTRELFWWKNADTIFRWGL